MCCSRRPSSRRSGATGRRPRLPLEPGRTSPRHAVDGTESLAAIKDWTFKLGPGFVVGIGNGLILGYLMLRSGLMPRGLALLGVIGGPIQALAGIGVLFDLYEASGPVQSIATIPEIIWELSLGIYPLVWGFRLSSPILAEEGRPVLDPAAEAR